MTHQFAPDPVKHDPVLFKHYQCQLCGLKVETATEAKRIELNHECKPKLSGRLKAITGGNL